MVHRNTLRTKTLTPKGGAGLYTLPSRLLRTGSFHGSKSSKITQRSRPVIGICVAVLMMGLSAGYKKNIPAVMNLEYAVLRATAPVVHMLQSSRDALLSVGTLFHTKVDLEREIHNLKTQNSHLHTQNTLISQALFNQEKHQQHLTQNSPLYDHPHLLKHKVHAHVTQSLQFAQHLMIRAQDDGTLSQNNVVLGTRGILGRILHANGPFGKVLTIFHVASRIPVDIQGVHGIAAGQNTSRLKLIHTKDVSIQNIKVGDTVHTSGFGGIFPKGLRLGRIASIHNGVIEITPDERGDTPPHSVMVIPPELGDHQE